VEGDVTEETKAGRLYVVSTPIGNMGDFSFRAVEVLGSVGAVLAEDTRHSRQLLDRYGIRTRMASYHEHNEAKTTPQLVARLCAGEDLAIISDAGTPLLSDPGQRLVRAAIDAGVTIVPVPGASAMLAALVSSGLDINRFTFLGFLPRKGRERAAAIADIASSRIPVVLYEGPARVAGTLQEVAKAAADREAVVARELTKQFEEVRRGTVESLGAYYSSSPPRGEVVIIVAGAEARALDESAVQGEAGALLARGHSVREVVRELVQRGVPRNAAYRIAKTAATEAANAGAAQDE
jgi:16S rRNA (cytidine1402-2'-O)-methyltransferase